MTGIILAFLSTGVGKIVVGIVGAVFTGLVTGGVAYLKGRSAGKQTERNAQAAREAHARDEAAEIDDAIAGRSPDANRDRLKKWRPK